ncbi:MULTISPECIES: DsbA family protein [Bacillales]|uniref:ClpXP adapter protein SpxH n=1 Tax=Lysinibacillus louembei TaxID=1470088 RepID=A0ABZ0RZN0_9BACI|nr:MULTISPECIES: DsbA family protein [Bacillales]MCT6925895.1 DsbA family protein [Metasolibacillus sp.]MCT6942071.1 DsbA family protein [Metasolibacillus sp.]WPK12335.1 DsbA family protein [Lysinibacillus louembei]
MNNIQMIPQSTASLPTIKPVELYIFIDPLCPNSFAMQSMLRKLQLEYEHYFSWRYVLSTELTSLNCLSNRIKGCLSGDELDITHPALPSIAIKAAELQGKRAGSRYLSKLQEHAALQTKNILSHVALTEIAAEVQLDMNEFTIDFGSKEAAHAFQCDLYITREMEVHEVPSIVFFNEHVEDEGLKVSGLYDYEVYEHILGEMIQGQLVRQPLPTLDELFIRFQTLTTTEVASIYQIAEPVAERELKKRMLQQKVERLMTDDIALWRLKGNIV